MVPYRLKSAKTAIGARQTLKALQRGEAELVYAAKDADEWVLRPVLDLCDSAGVEVVHIDSMRELGKMCQIDVGAACAAVLKE